MKLNNCAHTLLALVLSVLLAVNPLGALDYRAFAADEPDGCHADATAWTGTSTLGTAGTATSWYLADDLTLSGSGAITVRGNVTLCLNGKQANLATKYFNIAADSSLTINDCTGDGALSTAASQIVYINAANTAFTLNGGTLAGTKRNAADASSNPNRGTSSGIKVNPGSSPYNNYYFEIQINGGCIDTTAETILANNGSAGKNDAGNRSSVSISGGTLRSALCTVALKDEDIELNVSGDDTLISVDDAAYATQTIYLSNVVANMSGGTVQRVAGSKTGTAITAANATSFTMTGGSIVQPTSTHALEGTQTSIVTVSGGTIESAANGLSYTGTGTLNITGGSIVSTSGNGTYVNNSSAKLNVSGGSIQGTTQGLYVNASSSVKLSGGTFAATTGSPLKLNKTLTEALDHANGDVDYYADETAATKITYTATAKEISTPKTVYVLPVPSANTITFMDEHGTMIATEEISQTASSYELPARLTKADGSYFRVDHYELDGTTKQPGDSITVSADLTITAYEAAAGHTCEYGRGHDDSESFYTPIDNASMADVFANGTLAEGSYYLDDDLALSTPLTVTGTVKLCLNGHKLTFDSIAKDASGNVQTALALSAGAQLYLYDCTDSGAIERTGANASNLFKSDANASTCVTIFAGTYRGNGNICNGNITIHGGTISTSSNCAFYSNDSSGFVNIHGGTISISGNADSAAYGIFRLNGAQLTITGGEFHAQGNTCVIAPLYVNTSTKVALNATISGGVFYGSGIKPIINANVAGKSTITISGGTFTLEEGKRATTGVGAITLHSMGTAPINDATTLTVSGGTFSGYDTGIVSNGKTTISGAVTFNCPTGILNATANGNQGVLTLAEGAQIAAAKVAIENEATLAPNAGSIQITGSIDDAYFVKNDSAGTVAAVGYYQDAAKTQPFDAQDNDSVIPTNNVKTIYIGAATDMGHEGDVVSLTLITRSDAEGFPVTATLGPSGTIPALVQAADGTLHQIATFDVTGKGAGFTPLDASQYEYQGRHAGRITAYCVDRETLYTGQADANQAGETQAGEIQARTVEGLSRVFFVNTNSGFSPACGVVDANATSNLDKYDANYGLSPITAFTSMQDAGWAINRMYGDQTGRPYSSMKNHTYALILLGSSGNQYRLSDFETCLSQPTGALVDGKTGIQYETHYQAPTIFIGTSWLGKSYASSRLRFRSTDSMERDAGEGFAERYYANGATKHAQGNRTMLYGHTIIDGVTVFGSGDVFANGYTLTITENITTAGDSTGSIRAGGIPDGYPYITINGGTVANDDDVDRGVGAIRNPEGPGANITILSGRWGRVSGGSRSLSSRAPNALVTIGGTADIGTLAVAAVEGTYTGNSTAIINGGSIVNVIGSILAWPLNGQEENIRWGNTTIIINDGTIEDLCGGALGRYTTNCYQRGSTSITVNGGSVSHLWGGSAAGQTYGNITVNVTGGAVGSLFGAGSSRSKFIEDEYTKGGVHFSGSGAGTMIDGGIQQYGTNRGIVNKQKNFDGTMVVAYNADSTANGGRNVTNLGNTYGTVKVNVSGGTVSTLYGGGEGFDYDAYFAGFTGGATPTLYNIAQVCNCPNGGSRTSEGCANCDAGNDPVSADDPGCTCATPGAAVQVTISGGTIETDVYAGGAGLSTSNRIAKVCSGTSLTITGGTINGNAYGAGENAYTNGNAVIRVNGTATINGSVYGGGNYGELPGAANMNVDGSAGLTINGSIYAGGHNGSVGEAVCNVSHLHAGHLSGSIYSCGAGEEGSNAEIMNDVSFGISDITLNDGQFVYLGGAGYGHIRKNMMVTTDGSAVTYYNVHGCYINGSIDDRDYYEVILTEGSQSTFRGAERVDNGSDGKFTLTAGRFQYLIDDGGQTYYSATITWSTPQLTATQGGGTATYVWDAERSCYVLSNSAAGASQGAGSDQGAGSSQGDGSNQGDGSDLGAGSGQGASSDLGTSESSLAGATQGDVSIKVMNMSNAPVWYSIAEQDAEGFVLSHSAGSRNSTMVHSTAIAKATDSPAFADTIQLISVPQFAESAFNKTVATYTLTISTANTST